MSYIYIYHIIYPIHSLYAIYAYIDPPNRPNANVGKYTIHGAFGLRWYPDLINHGENRSFWNPTLFRTLVSDPSLAFPHSSVELQSETYEHTKDLLISRMCPGVQLGRYVADLDLRKPQDQEQLEAVAMKIGELLAEFHLRYTDPMTGEPTYHTDFHPSNVLYDAKTETLSIIDLEGMGSLGITDDVEKFERLLWGMAGERYASAFHLRYTALAPKVAASRSSTKSTATGMSISSEDLYPADASVVTRLRRGGTWGRRTE